MISSCPVIPGEVYKAKDTRLDRFVAIKVISASIANDARLRERLEREAKAISQLTHPNLCRLYDVGEHEGTYFLVLEYLEGATLAELIAKGPLPISDALRLAAEIADGLALAHRHGIVHRDVKPSNIMVTRSGAKLLDFGLARTDVARAGGKSESPTVPMPLTSEGVAVGTPFYMAPEQIAGDPVDGRTDLFALGLVLYEAISGKRAFSGETNASITKAILSDTPTPLSELVPHCPERAVHLVTSCLEKEPDARWQNAADLARELRWQPSAESAAPPARSARAPWVFLGAAAIVLALVASFWPRGALDVRGLSIGPPAGTYFVGNNPALSPDGKLLAFRASDRMLWLHDLATGEARPLIERPNFSFFSPDGTTLYTTTPSRGFVALALDTATERAHQAAVYRGAALNEEGTFLYTTDRRSPLFRSGPDGEALEPVTKLDPEAGEVSHRHPQFLSDGEHFIFLNMRRSPEETTLDLGSLSDGNVKTLARSPSAGLYADGHIFYVQEGNLLAQPLDERAWELTGSPVSIASDVGATFGFPPNVAVSESGAIVYGPDPDAWETVKQLAWYDRSGTRLEELGEPADYCGIALSPDGERVAACINTDIWILDRAGVGRRLTSHPMDERAPVWSPDGRSVLFHSDRDGGSRDLYVGALTQDDPPRKILDLGPHLVPSGWDASGRIWFASVPFDGRNEDIWTFVNGEPVPFRESPFRELEARPSTDGRWLATVSNETGRYEIYVEPLGRGGERRRVSGAGGISPRWRGDGRELYFRDREGYVVAADVNAAYAGRDTPRRLFRAPAAGGFYLWGAFYAPSPDGERFLVIEQPDRPPSAPYTVLVNWRDAVTPLRDFK